MKKRAKEVKEGKKKASESVFAGVLIGFTTKANTHGSVES